MLKPDEGQILYRGQPIDQMSKKEWNDYIGKISYMFQNNALFDSMTVYENMGHEVAQQIIRSLGAYINKHFGAVGGFSSRQTINEYATVLPYSNLEESNQIMKDFTKDFKEHGIKDYVEHEIWELDPNVENDDQSGEYVDFSVLAQGKPQIEIESVMEFARFNQKELARFRCARGGEKGNEGLGFELRVTGYELRVTSCELRVAGFGLRVTGSSIADF